MPRGGPEGKILGDVFSRVGGIFIGIGVFRRYDVPVLLETLRQRCTCAQAAGDFLAFRVADERRKCCAGEPTGRAERYQLEAGGVTAAADGEAVLDGVFRVGGHPELRGKHRKAQLSFLAAVHCERDHRAGLHAALHHGLLSDPGGGQAVGCCHGAVRERADVGALLVSRSFDSSNEAQVHKDGQTKTEQAATLTIDTLEPVMVYKLQSLAERVKRLQMSYSELYNLIVAELTQAIVNKIVDLALVEGDGTNGFKSIDKEADAKKIKKITTKAKSAGKTPFADAIEEAVDFVRPTAGRRYLIVKAEDRKALLDELRQATANANVRIKNDDAEIASEVGVDEIIVYTGTKAVKPTVLVDQKYHIDMQDLTKVDAFEWKTNSNMILVETLTSGHVETYNAGAVITVA